jgi:probable F420-dependent oxidoreductase
VVELGTVGIWTRQLDSRPGREAQEAVDELEGLGYRTVWIPEAVEREVISHATLLLAGSSSIVVATGIARVQVRAPQAVALAQLMLAERFPGRFLLGLGVSHQVVVERQLAQVFRPPLQVMSDYLDAIDTVVAARHPAPPVSPSQRVLAALGPKMLDLARERSAGAHTYLAPVEHTAWARSHLGPGPLLVPAIKVVLDGDRERAGDIARRSVGAPGRLPAYRQNLRRAGFADADLDDGVSQRLVDALVACGGVGEVVERVTAHLEAGADHVCVEVLTGDDTTVPMEAWRELAPALTAIR